MNGKKKVTLLAIVLVPLFLICSRQQSQADTVTIDPQIVRVAVGEQATVMVTCTNCFEPYYYYSMANPSVASYYVESQGIGGANITITGISAGSTVFSVTVYTSGNYLTVSCDVKVRSGMTCPTAAVLEGDPQKEGKLGILRYFRDKKLANSPKGRHYIELFYKHAKEMVELMSSYPELHSQSYSLLVDFLPTIMSSMNGEPVTVTEKELVDIEALIESFAEKASPEMQNDLRVIQEELNQGNLEAIWD